VKNGSGLLGLYGTQSYEGNTTVSGGTLRLLTNLSSALITVNDGASLDIEGSATRTVNNLTLNNGSTLTIDSNARLQVNGILTVNTSISDEVLGRIILGSTGSVITTDPSGLGAATYTRQIDGVAGWRMLSAPHNNMPVSVLNDRQPIQGWAAPYHPLASSNFYTGHDGTTWTPTNPSESTVPATFSAGDAFMLWFFNNTQGGSQELPVTLTST
jgi:autotransporter-associated beta strand protein